ncbi:hypothetical protein E2C01_071523 [Portunus trituberculatus]|uniref:Uncharacterized protein n=1 Tax=Portunus trituberculatus TaxID=210409 RepID=A0A5B7I876_PORTR|nr:hypothetical protein [Portunus trituberculatus]
MDNCTHSKQCWCSWPENSVIVNNSRTAVIYVCTSSVAVSPPQLSVDPHCLQVVQLAKLLGVTVDSQLSWKQHVTTTVMSAIYRLYMLHRLKSLGSLVPHLHPLQGHQQLEIVQKTACNGMQGHPWPYTNYDHALTTLSLPKLSARHQEAMEKLGKGLLHHPRL